MKTQSKTGRPTEPKGQSLAEFAVGMTLVLIMVAGGLDLGRAYFNYLSVRDAAQEGAAYASIAPASAAGIRQRVRQTSSAPVDFSTFSDDQILVQLHGPPCAGSTINVTVTFQFHLAAPFVAGEILQLTSTASDTVLQPACP